MLPYLNFKTAEAFILKADRKICKPDNKKLRVVYLMGLVKVINKDIKNANYTDTQK